MVEKTCAHAACSCSLEADDLYGSESCRSSSERPIDAVDGCDCRLPDCLGVAGREGDDALAKGEFGRDPPGGPGS